MDKQSLLELARKGNDGIDLGKKISIVSNGVDLHYFKPGTADRQPDLIVFSGKMSYHANYSMAIYLIQKVMPLIWMQKPNVRLRIVGKSPSTRLSDMAKKEPRIDVTGSVPDIRPYLEKASVAVVPLLYGAGIQNKILESMACGTPVVASSLAGCSLQASPNKEILIADGPEATASTLLRLLSDKKIQTSIGQAGRNYVQNHHNWDNIAGQLEKIYQESYDNLR
jgi:glycosyltransferase involved in cell wall biosynthesis